MSKIDDGGKAFPGSAGGSLDKGMTLRDWFAGKALAGLVSKDGAALAKSAIRTGKPPDEVVAVMSYELADAMLAERKKAGEP